MLSKLSAENPYSVIITGDLNCSTSQQWENNIDNEEGKVFEPFTSDLGLNQLISEATHIMGDSKSCIDVILTGQPVDLGQCFQEKNCFPLPVHLLNQSTIFMTQMAYPS